VEDFDPELYKNLKWCLENSISGIGLMFSEQVTHLGVVTEVEYILNGKNIEVSDENKFEYV